MPAVSQLMARKRPAALYRVEISTEGEMISEHTLGAGRVVIGRAPDNEIYIKSKFVSRHHAQIISDQDTSVIEDLNSTNGVYIGNNRLTKYALQDGDVVSLGVHELKFIDLRQQRGDAAGSDSSEDSRAANDSTV